MDLDNMANPSDLDLQCHQKDFFKSRFSMTTVNSKTKENLLKYNARLFYDSTLLDTEQHFE